MMQAIKSGIILSLTQILAHTGPHGTSPTPVMDVTTHTPSPPTLPCVQLKHHRMTLPAYIQQRQHTTLPPWSSKDGLHYLITRQ